MKAIKFKNLMMVLSVALCSVTIIACDDDDDLEGRNYTISGNASGSQVVPAVAGTGSGTITGNYNNASNSLTYTTTWTGLTGAPTSGRFYSGMSGTAGTTVGNEWVFPGGSTGTGTISGTMTLTEAQEADLLAGRWYYSYGTATNPTGEVRGQMTATAQ